MHAVFLRPSAIAKLVSEAPLPPLLASHTLKARLRDAWSALEKSDVAALRVLGFGMEAAVNAVDAAITQRKDLEAQVASLRKHDERKRLFKEVNGLRARVGGVNAKLPDGKLGMAASFADLFFRYSSWDGARSDGGSRRPSRRTTRRPRASIRRAPT